MELVLYVPPPPTMSCYPPTPFLGVDIASIINPITTESPSPSPPSPAIDITGAFPSVCEGEKLSSKFDKKVAILCLNFQDIQQRCYGMIGKAKHSFCLKNMANCQVYSKEGDHFKSTFKPTPNH